MNNRPQSVAILVVFRAFLASDHVTPATGKTIAITISKNGGAFGNPNAGALNATEISSGWYKAALDTTDSGTAGPLAVRGAEGTIDDVGVEYYIQAPPSVNVTQLLGTAWLTPGTAGTPDVNAKLIGGTAQTGRDIGASVLLSAGSGAGQLDFTSGVVKSNLAQILATALTEGGAGRLAAAFKAFLDVAVPVFTAASVNQTGDSFARIGAAGAGLTGVTGATLSAAYDAAKTAAQAGDAMALVNNAITSAKIAANAIAAAGIATDAIDADALAADAVAEIVAGVLAGVITEVSAVPGASPTLKQALALLYQALRNKLDVDATSKTVHTDAGAAVGAKALSDDGTTYSEAKMA